MRRLAAAAVVFVALAVVGSASATIRPARGMSGVTLGMTAAQVQAKLGRPVVKSAGRWYYPTVTVAFRARRVVELTTTKSVERLSNGLGIHSSEAQLRSAFPQVRCAAWSLFRRCRLGTEAPGSRVTDFILARGRVFQITIARLA
jgi:outer membrane protein assembly factor BamE (lipoprotein component of BamABCDE complex)